MTETKTDTSLTWTTVNDEEKANINHKGNGTQKTEQLMAAQSVEILAMEDELKAFRKNWRKGFCNLQERHKKELERFFELDNYGYEI